jgi:N-acetylmuramoyl-L-alanine amidase
MLKHFTKVSLIVAAVSFSLGVATNSYSRQAEAELQQKQLVAQRALEAKLQKEINCLARNIYFESGSEPYRGKIAVAQVTMNRVQSGEFPHTVCGVVHQKTHYEGTTVCQFSWVCEGNLKIRAPELYNESLQVAKKVMLGGVRLPELRGAKYFHADYIQPNWGKKPKAKIGRHIFY